MVMPAARTGKERRRRTAVIRTAQTKRGVWYWVEAGGFMLIMVVMKLIAPRIDETPARWREKIVRSTEAPAWAKLLASGGTRFSPCLHLLLPRLRPVRERRKEEVVKSSCYSFEGKLCQGLPTLGGLVSCQSRQS